MRFLMTIALALIVFEGTCQTAVFRHDVQSDWTFDDRGPNRKRFTQGIVGYGFIAGTSESDSATIIGGRSAQFYTGYRSKFKISERYALGYGLTFVRKNFFLEQDSTKLLPTPDIWKREKLQTTSLRVDLYQRFNFKKRGDFLGEYLDIGGYFNYHLAKRHVIVDDSDLPSLFGSRNSRIVNSGLQYMQDYSYGLNARLGWNVIVLFGEYRLSDLFQSFSGRQFPELPRLTIGIELGLFS